MTKNYLTVVLLLMISTAQGQKCEWSAVKVSKDTLYFLSKPLDVGQKLVEGKVLLQGIIIGNSRLLVLNVKNDAISNTNTITLKSKTGDLTVIAIDVDTKMLIAKSQAVFIDPTTHPIEKQTYFSDLESKENKYTFFEITPSNIDDFSTAEFVSFQTKDVSIDLVKSTAKRLRTMVGCLK